MRGNTTKYLSHTIALAVVFAVFVPVSSLAGTWKGREVVKEGVRHVVNPADGIEPPRTIQLKEFWRIGGESDDEAEFFGLVKDMAVDHAGNVYVLDYQLSQLKVYSPDGEFLRTIGREGDGPGEFRRSVAVCVSPTGLVGVVTPFPSRIVQFTPLGEPAATIAIPPDADGIPPGIMGVLLACDHLVVHAVNQFMTETKEEQLMYLCAIDAKGHETARYYEEGHVNDFAKPVVDERGPALAVRWSVDDNGRVFAASSFSDYQITVWRPDGQIDRVIEKEYEHRKRSADEKKFVRDWMDSEKAVSWPGSKTKIEDYDKDIMSLWVRGDGRCWVLTSRGFYDRPEGSLGVFDVFDKEGHHIKEMTLMGEGDPFEDRYYFLGERLYVVAGFVDALKAFRGRAGGLGGERSEEPAPISVICYKISSSP